MLGKYIIGWFVVLVHIVRLLIPRTIQQIIEIKRMDIIPLIVEIGTDNGKWTLIVSPSTATAIYFIAGTFDVASVPIIFPVSGIYSFRVVPSM